MFILHTRHSNLWRKVIFNSHFKAYNWAQYIAHFTAKVIAIDPSGASSLRLIVQFHELSYMSKLWDYGFILCLDKKAQHACITACITKVDTWGGSLNDEKLSFYSIKFYRITMLEALFFCSLLHLGELC